MKRRVVALLLAVYLFAANALEVVALNADSLQVYTSIDRQTVAVGEPLVVTVDVYTTTSDENTSTHLSSAIRDMMVAEDGAFQLLKITHGAPTRKQVENREIIWLQSRVVLKPRNTGASETPEIRFMWSERTYQTEPHRVDVYAVGREFFRTSGSIFPIVAVSEGIGRPRICTGTAFLVAPDAIVTSYHVIIDAVRVYVQLPGGKRIATARAWALDPVRDVAILYVDPTAVRKAGINPIPVLSEEVVATGHQVDDHTVVFTNGWPGNTQRSTAGVLFRNALPAGTDPIWVSANPLLPGDSGGPLLDGEGRAVAVVSAGTTRRSSDVLRENVCLATDFRPALRERLFRRRPGRLSTMLRDRRIVGEPRAQALRLTAYLGARTRFPEMAEALRTVDKGAETLRDDARFHFLRGTIYDMLGRTSQASQAYQASLAASPGYFPSVYMLALHDLGKKEFGLAAGRFHTLEGHVPYRHLARYGLAVTQIRMLDYESAILYLNEVLHHDPSFAPAWYDLAQAYLALDNEDAAYAILIRLEKTDKNWAERLKQTLQNPILQFIKPVKLPLAAFDSIS